MITNVIRHASRSLKISPTMEVYYDLAQASGGQAIQVSKSNLSVATGIIEDSSASALVSAREAHRSEHCLTKYSMWEKL